MLLAAEEEDTLQQILAFPEVRRFVAGRPDRLHLEIEPKHRGIIKQELMRHGFPVEDQVGYHAGETLAVRFKPDAAASGGEGPLRDYQSRAVDSFFQQGHAYGGSGILVLPCGTGKTMIGIAAMVRLRCAALILTSNGTSVRQWKREILRHTDLDEQWIGEYCGDRKQVRPVTVATYQILTHRKTKTGEFAHMHLLKQRDWGLIIYDEVHLLPAPVFRATADIQATRRLGLTATLVREDGREKDVFSLIGPKRYEVSWKKMEQSGWIAEAECVEIRIPLTPADSERYGNAQAQQRHRIAGENHRKADKVKELVRAHKGESILVIGQYLTQVKRLARLLEAPLICGETPQAEREKVYDDFRKGKVACIVVSKVANFAVDLPDASVAVQISGSFGSRQEEAQRLGRIVRPKSRGNRAWFYSLVSEHTCEQEMALNRQLFLTEQGYRYTVQSAGSAASAETAGGGRA